MNTRASFWSTSPEDPILPAASGAPTRPQSSAFFREDLAAIELPTTWSASPDEPGVPFEFRSTRRSFATWLEAHDVPGDHVDRLLGHAAASVRRRHYAAADVQALARAVGTIRLEVPLGAGTREGTFARILPAAGASSGETACDVRRFGGADQRSPNTSFFG